MSHWENSSKSDEWYTPKYIFDALGCVFDLDVAAPADRQHCHVPANAFISESSLSAPWNGFIWMNPPFGGRNGLVPWLQRFIGHGNGIALTPDRISAPWWQQTAKRSHAVLFVAGKPRFIRPDGTPGIQPSHGITLFAMGDRALDALTRAQSNHLGIVMIRRNPRAHESLALPHFPPQIRPDRLQHPLPQPRHPGHQLSTLSTVLPSPHQNQQRKQPQP